MWDSRLSRVRQAASQIRLAFPLSTMPPCKYSTRHATGWFDAAAGIGPRITYAPLCYHDTTKAEELLFPGLVGPLAEGRRGVSAAGAHPLPSVVRHS
jgi:hypothetical protein